MDTSIAPATPVKRESLLQLSSIPLRPRPLEIPSASYYNRWKHCDKLFEGKFSGPPTPMSPATPAMSFLQKSFLDVRDFTTPYMPRIRKYTSKDLDSPCYNTYSQSKIVESPKSRYDNDFIQLEVLGAGEFGRVYKCVHRIDGLQYAVKKINTQPSKKSSIASALQEAYVLATSSINEDNAYVVRYHSVWQESDSLFISMELCQCSLAKYIKDHETTEAVIRKILRDICKALKKLHCHDIVHMDIKSENILYSYSNKFKLGDLGLGRVTTNLGDICEGDSRYLAKEVLAPATDEPEQIPDLTKADIFSLGATCYEIMRDKPLPKNGPEWHRIRSVDIEDCPGFSKEINQCIKKMMSPVPEQRPSAQELLESVLLSEKQLQVKRWRNYAGTLETEISELKERLGLKRRKFSM